MDWVRSGIINVCFFFVNLILIENRVFVENLMVFFIFIDVFSKGFEIKLQLSFSLGIRED